MPIRAHCTICSDFFDNHKDVAAIHCGHTFHQECLIQWFHTAPSRTCPQCRIQVSKRHIINKLFFDVALEEQTSLDAESIQNELDKVKAQLSMKEKEKRDCQSIIDTLRETVDVHSATIESLQKVLCETEMLCSTLKKQMKYLEQQQEETKGAKEEARRLRNKLKTMERIEMLLQSQRPEVEEMIRDMGIGQAAVEQLAVYCVSLKKEYENLKEARKASNEMTEKLKKELFSANNKLQKTFLELEKMKEELKSTQKDLSNADKEIMSLKKKIGILQETLKVPSVTSETLSRLVFESPAPVELLSPKLHRPAHSNKIDLDTTFDVETPEHQPHKSITTPAKKPKLDKKPPLVTNLAKKVLKETVENGAGEPEEDPLEEFFPAFIRNSVLSRKPPVGSLLGPHKNSGAVRMGYDGLGGRTKFIQPVSFPTICAAEISGQESLLCFPLIWVFPSDKPNGDPSLSCEKQEEECLQASIHNCSSFLLWHQPGKTGQLPSVNLKAFLVT
ncbi:E3 ubiquitin-protein ligase TRAIP isoform X1 [Chelonoidis abingdonii]|uniref:E3 ubiquitin-protein ligase TRAIP isoform X1 n=1 Tax=Chelonoidis abingdonii TaxID=106734 RepID=UPI0013F1DAD5|nr:E3 ubiquitin-protein ligase TRAIP isoform X1 [Chelonoidis abingdonii]XP_032638954.1 E3 ubiquitin-protein ligase TRAIP isoform X1 [Chelonoidis abingdonii]XP_032638955.1 E3 ubiquitin-protein ligase TRAIP isoform X1 [Chelonoidis abingdonii]